MNDTLFRILGALIIVGTTAISVYHRRKAERVSGEKISLKDEGLALTIALRGSGLALWLTIFAYLLNPAWTGWARIDLPEWLRWVGVGMGISSIFLAYWVFSNLGNNVSPTVVTRKNHTLVTSGPYRWVRHPLYGMGFIAYGGFALLAENWFVMLLAVVAVVLLAIRTPKEEARLIERFGDEYRAYMQRTGRFLPKL